MILCRTDRPFVLCVCIVKDFDIFRKSIYTPLRLRPTIGDGQLETSGCSRFAVTADCHAAVAF